MPVFGTSAATFNDDGVTALFQHLVSLLAPEGLAVSEGILPIADVKFSSGIDQVVPPERTRYLAEITETVRGYHATTDDLVAKARRAAAARSRGGGAFGRLNWPVPGEVADLLEDARKAAARTRSPSRSRAGPRSSRRTPATRWSSASARPRTTRR